jgi:hypothetical protein
VPAVDLQRVTVERDQRGPAVLLGHDREVGPSRCSSGHYLVSQDCLYG